MPVAVVVAVDPVLRGALVADAMLDRLGVVELRYEVDMERGALRRLVIGPEGILGDADVELEHPCVSCAMREDAIPVLDRMAGDPRIEAVLLSPPISADPQVVAGTLAGHQRLWHLSSVAALADADSAVEDILGDATLAERGLQWAEEDHRSVGEAVAGQIEFADLVVRSGEDERGAELIEHLRAADQILVPSVHDVDVELLLGGELDREAAMRRRDPLQVEPHGGPTLHGTWTLDLCSQRPFHPERFLENIEALGAGRLRGRGRFWVPDRPATICQWDGAGGQVSIGAFEEISQGEPSTRLVVTGVDPADLPRVRDAFARSLLTQAEWRRGLAPWLGAEDLLAPWLGERGARV